MAPLAVRQIATAPPLDERAVARRIGLLVLATDHTSERDFARMVPASEAGVYVSRVPYANPTTPENLRRMQPELERAAALILPDEPLDVLCYACTAASVVMGDATIAEALGRTKPGAQVVTPALAARAALQALDARRIAILTPNNRELGERTVEYFAAHGFEVSGLTCLGLEDDRTMARIRPQAIAEAAREAADPEADALFISCTALRAAAVADEIEAAIGKPVVTSNQASVWLSLRLAGLYGPVPGFGRLLALDHRAAA